MPETSIDLYWIPLGAGGAGFVRFNGRVSEAIKARLEARPPLDLYHTALEVRVPEGRFIIENAWPSPDADITARGVVAEGPVGSRRIARFRPFRYEVRRWRDGVIPDVGEAVASPFLVTTQAGYGAFSTWWNRCRHRSGGETSLGRAKCGTRTR